jgi:diguanylate cyclase (GGDEF)-like protein
LPFLIVFLLLTAAWVAERKRRKREYYVSGHDSLTGLYNRERFFEKSHEVLHRYSKKKMVMVCTNIKNFKLTNDLFGYEMGDRVLLDQSDILKAIYKKEDCVLGRIAGDKFAMLVPKGEFEESDVIENSSKLQYLINDANYKLHIAVGVYEVTDINESPQIMCDKANMAIESLKDDYGTIVAYYDAAMLDSLVNEKNVLSDFDNGINNGQFKMYLQPQIACDGTLIGAEAIVRWHHPKLGVLMPADFIEIVEKRGFIYKLDYCMWEQAAKCLSIWQQKGIDNLSISVNVSTKDFFYTDIYKTFTKLVEKYKINPSRLNIEITETLFMENAPRHMEVISKLKAYGFCIELDDFGSGYSSLNMLKDIEADVIKIDMAFLEETSNTKRSHTIIKSIINMAKDLDMKVITEGVRTKQHVEFLTEAGCDIFQGFYYSMPIIVEEFERKYIATGGSHDGH